MFNILVPTDFSPLSKVAIQFAIEIANQHDGNVTLLHVVRITQSMTVPRIGGPHNLEQDMVSEADKELQKLMREVSYDCHTPEPISWSVAKGPTVREAIRKEANRLKSALIVMGTRGASGLKKAVIGSNTTALIEVSDVPVLVVPETAQFRGFKDIVYASDLRDVENELKVLIPYVEKFDSTIHLLHVQRPGANIEEIEKKIDEIVTHLGYSNIVTLVLVDPIVEGAIDQYISVSKSDLLAMFTHDLNFYEKILDKSMTRKMAFQSNVPLLAFKR